MFKDKKSQYCQDVYSAQLDQDSQCYANQNQSQVIFVNINKLFLKFV